MHGRDGKSSCGLVGGGWEKFLDGSWWLWRGFGQRDGGGTSALLYSFAAPAEERWENVAMSIWENVMQGVRYLISRRRSIVDEPMA
jgi:hypothetical protein